MPKIKFNSFPVLGIDFKSPSRFFRLLGFTPHSIVRINKTHGSIDEWTLARFKSLTPEQVQAHLSTINDRDMSFNKYRACLLIRDAIAGQLDRVDISQDDPARMLLANILQHDNLNDGLKEFTKEH